jgi:hypothetical protein
MRFSCGVSSGVMILGWSVLFCALPLQTKKERPANGELVAAVSNSVAATGLSVHAQPAEATPSKKVLEAVLEKLKK